MNMKFAGSVLVGAIAVLMTQACGQQANVESSTRRISYTNGQGDKYFVVSEGRLQAESRSWVASTTASASDFLASISYFIGLSSAPESPVPDTLVFMCPGTVPGILDESSCIKHLNGQPTARVSFEEMYSKYRSEMNRILTDLRTKTELLSQQMETAIQAESEQARADQVDAQAAAKVQRDLKAKNQGLRKELLAYEKTVPSVRKEIQNTIAKVKATPRHKNSPNAEPIERLLKRDQLSLDARIAVLEQELADVNEAEGLIKKDLAEFARIIDEAGKASTTAQVAGHNATLNAALAKIQANQREVHSKMMNALKGDVDGESAAVTDAFQIETFMAEHIDSAKPMVTNAQDLQSQSLSYAALCAALGIPREEVAATPPTRSIED